MNDPMARGGRIRSTARRLAGIALEDFGLRPPPAPPRTPPPVPAPPATPPPEPAPPATTPVPPPATPVVDAATEVVDVADDVEVAAPGAAELDGPPAGIVWQGAATRRPELQRFCDHLEKQRAALVDAQGRQRIR